LRVWGAKSPSSCLLSKSGNRVSGSQGETCSEKVEKPFIIKADYLKGMVIAKRKRFI